MTPSPDNSVSVRRDSHGATRHTLQVRNHRIPVDALVASGGADVGAAPHDLYDGALAACKALTVLLYAQRKKMAVEDIEVTVVRDDSQERQGTYRLQVLLQISGPLSEAQREELLRVAAHCPIHHLMTEVRTEIETGWAT